MCRGPGSGTGITGEQGKMEDGGEPARSSALGYQAHTQLR